MSDSRHNGTETSSRPASAGDQEHTGTRGLQQRGSAVSDGLLNVIRNLAQYHREHEKYYSEAPLADAISLQRTARTLIAPRGTLEHR